MCLIPDYTTSEPPVRGDTIPIGYELEPLPASDTIPCPPPDWEESELE